MKKIFVFCFLFFCLNYLTAQIKFQKLYGTNKGGGACTRQTSDKGYVVAGTLFNPSASATTSVYDLYIAKTDSTGNLIWDKKYITGAWTQILSVIEADDDGFLIVATNGDASKILFCIKTDAMGNTLWIKEYSNLCGGYDVESGSQKTSDGGYIITGIASTSISLLKLDANGNALWHKLITIIPSSIFSNEQCVGMSIQQTADAGYIITGQVYYGGVYSNDILLARTNSNGEPLWMKNYGESTAGDVGNCVKQTADGGFIVTGGSASMSGLAYTNIEDAFLMKTDSAGNQQWTKMYGGIQTDRGVSLQMTNDGGYIITGFSFSFHAAYSNPFIYLIKTNGIGDLTWSRAFGKSSDVNYGYSVQQTPDNGYVIGASVNNVSAHNAYLSIIKTDELGYAECDETDPVETIKDTLFPVISKSFTYTSITGTMNPVVYQEAPVSQVLNYCFFIGIDELSTHDDKLLFPNPNNGSFEFTGMQKGENIRVFNIESQLIYQNEILLTGNLKVDLVNAVKGIYFYKITNQNNEVASGKFIIQ